MALGQNQEVGILLPFCWFFVLFFLNKTFSPKNVIPSRQTDIWTRSQKTLHRHGSFRIKILLLHPTPDSHQKVVPTCVHPAA